MLPMCQSYLLPRMLETIDLGISIIPFLLKVFEKIVVGS